MASNQIASILPTDQGKRNTTVFLFVLSGLLWLLLAVNKPLGDYANYYYGSVFALKQVPAKEIYEPIAFNQLIREKGEQEVFANYAPVPPFSLLFYIPFTLVKAGLSKFLFGLLGLSLAALSLFRLLRRYPVTHYSILLLPWILLLPLKSNLYLGQSYLYILCFLIEGFIFSHQKKGALISALFFSLTIALKLFPAVVLIYLLFTGKRKIAAYTIAFTALWFAASLPFIGTEQLVSYLIDSIPRLSIGEINDPYSSSYQSMTVLLKKILVPDALLNPNAWFNLPALFQLFNIIYSAWVLSLCIKACRSHSYSDLFQFGFTLFCGLLVSGYGTSYTLLLVALLFVPLMHTDTSKWYLYATLLLFIASFPIHWFFGSALLLQFMRLYALLFLFGILISYQRISFSPALFLIVLCTLALPATWKYWNTMEDKSTYYNHIAPSLLVYDYKPSPQGITIKYYDEKGMHDLFYRTTDTLYIDKNISEVNGHIYYKGKSITFGKNNNKSPMRLNAKEVLYLSDKGRGMGLYALRKIQLPDEGTQ